MDSKIILAVLIVALIGVVAATYNADNGSIMDTLTGVKTEESGVTDVAGVESQGDAQNQINTASGSVSANQEQPNSQVSSSSNTNNGASQKQSDNSRQSSNTQNQQQQDTVKKQNSNSQSSSNSNSGSSQSQSAGPKISKGQALAIAKKAIPSSFSGAQPSISSTTTVNGVPYYNIVVSKSGRVVGELEINGNTGSVSGGAFEGEVSSTNSSSR